MLRKYLCHGTASDIFEKCIYDQWWESKITCLDSQVFVLNVTLCLMLLVIRSMKSRCIKHWFRSDVDHMNEYCTTAKIILLLSCFSNSCCLIYFFISFHIILAKTVSRSFFFKLQFVNCVSVLDYFVTIVLHTPP